MHDRMDTEGRATQEQLPRRESFSICPTPRQHPS